jgi:hypothetical protein
MFMTLIALVLLGASLALVFYLAGLLWRAASLPLGPVLERKRMERYVARARRGDELLGRGEVGPAMAELQGALYPHLVRDRALAQLVLRHHTGLLSRYIAAADHLHGDRVRLISLAKADRLLQERGALQRRYLTVAQGGKRQRLRELEREFRANTQELRATLALLAEEIGEARGEARFQYH